MHTCTNTCTYTKTLLTANKCTAYTYIKTLLTANRCIAYTYTKTLLIANNNKKIHLLIEKFRLKLKKVGKTTRTFRYDLNQISYNYTVEVRNKIPGIRSDRQSAWRTMDSIRDIVQKAVIKTISKKKKCKRAKWLSEEALQIADKRREVKGKGEKKRYTHLNAEFQRTARIRKPSSVINAKK